jgi:hypothetical protein
MPSKVYFIRFSREKNNPDFAGLKLLLERGAGIK